MVVAQLIARSSPIRDEPGSYAVIGYFYWIYLLLTVRRKDENKESVSGPYKKVFLNKRKDCFYCRKNASCFETYYSHLFPTITYVCVCPYFKYDNRHLLCFTFEIVSFCCPNLCRDIQICRGDFWSKCICLSTQSFYDLQLHWT